MARPNGPSRKLLFFSALNLLGPAEWAFTKHRSIRFWLSGLRVVLQYVAIVLWVGKLNVAATMCGVLAILLYLYCTFTFKPTVQNRHVFFAMTALPDLNFVFDTGGSAGALVVVHALIVIVNIVAIPWLVYELFILPDLTRAWGCYPSDAKPSSKDDQINLFRFGVCPAYSHNARSPVCGWLGWEGSVDASARCEDPAVWHPRNALHAGVTLLSSYFTYVAFATKRMAFFA